MGPSLSVCTSKSIDGWCLFSSLSLSLLVRLCKLLIEKRFGDEDEWSESIYVTLGGGALFALYKRWWPNSSVFLGKENRNRSVIKVSDASRGVCTRDLSHKSLHRNFRIIQRIHGLLPLRIAQRTDSTALVCFLPRKLKVYTIHLRIF